VFTAPARNLPFPIDNVLAVEAETPEQEAFCVVPVFPEDSDEKITVLFRLSLNEFVALASAIDAGRDIAFGVDAVKIWWLWTVNLMCASFCEEMVACLETDTDVQNALATLLSTNQTLIDAIQQAAQQQLPIAGKPLTDLAAGSSILPANVFDGEECIEDALWGACLYLVQFANRTITDFFEQLEVATNQIERAQIVSDAIPAGGSQIAAVAGFADQIAEEFQEGYAGQYDSEYENGLACELFCLALEDCDLSIDDIINVMNARLGATAWSSFAAVMLYVSTGTFVGVQIVDGMMGIFFTALRFGQAFGDVLGLGTLTDNIGLGADVLASDNWETLCDCDTFDVLVYNDYTRLTLKQTLNVQNGIPFTITVEPASWGTNEFFAVWTANKETHYAVAVGTYTATIGEAAYAYFDDTGTLITGAAGIPATDLPNDTTTRGIFMNANEADSSTHAVQITLGAIS
jgi:hypothetical protein